MNRLKKFFITGLAVAGISMAVYTPKADAYALISLIAYGYVPSVTGTDVGDTVLCIAVLPFCLLEEKMDASAITERDLRDNGYNQEEIGKIRAGQKAFMSFLEENKLRVEKSGDMTAGQLAAIMRNVPGMTAEYVDFFRSN